MAAARVNAIKSLGVKVDRLAVFADAGDLILDSSVGRLRITTTPCVEITGALRYGALAVARTVDRLLAISA